MNRIIAWLVSIGLWLPSQILLIMAKVVWDVNLSWWAVLAPTIVGAALLLTALTIALLFARAVEDFDDH